MVLQYSRLWFRKHTNKKLLYVGHVSGTVLFSTHVFIFTQRYLSPNKFDPLHLNVAWFTVKNQIIFKFGIEVNFLSRTVPSQNRRQPVF